MQLRTMDLHSAVSFHDRSFLPARYRGGQRAKNKSIILFLSILNAYSWSWSRGKRLTCHLTKPNYTAARCIARLGASDLGSASISWDQAVNLQGWKPIITVLLLRRHKSNTAMLGFHIYGCMHLPIENYRYRENTGID